MKHLYLTLVAIVLLLFGSYASAQVPVLNSYPASNAVIFLDFDGHNVVGTSWNGSGALVCDGANLTPTQITEVFNRVAEDYRPFTINVTTDSAKYWAAPATKRTRVILTTSSSWYGMAGGVAYMNSFSWGDNTPCFVFTALLNYNTKNISEAASHEAGHTLGLRHQSAYDPVCNRTAEYNAGEGGGAIGWAPIMGVGYYRNMTLWNYGANPYGCTSYQDDLSVITSPDNGISFRADDHGNTTSSATGIGFSSNAFELTGIIEKPADVDAFKFTTTTNGRVAIDVLPFEIAAGGLGANVDLEIELINGDNVLISKYNPSDLLNASIDTSLNAGTYYLRVQGKGNAYAPNYAVLGSYTLKGTFTPVTPLPVHKLALKGTAENKQHKLEWEIIADEMIVGQTVEASADGRGFSPLSSVTTTDRKFDYTPSAQAQTYYRLSVRFDNGRTYYSNTIVLRNTANPKPYLIGNVTSNQLLTNSPAGYTYSIFDLSGRSVAKGKLATGTTSISAGTLTSGLYIIQFANNGELYSEKFSKQ